MLWLCNPYSVAGTIWCWQIISNLPSKLFDFLKMDQYRPLFVYFRLFNMIQIKYILIKALVVVCLDSNQGQQDGRHRRIHWAMAAPLQPICSQNPSGWKSSVTISFCSVLRSKNFNFRWNVKNIFLFFWSKSGPWKVFEIIRARSVYDRDFKQSQ